MARFLCEFTLLYSMILVVYLWFSQEASTPDLITPGHEEIAASLCPKQLIESTIKQKKKEKTGQPYKLSKYDSMQSQNINWKSPTGY